MGGSYTAFLLLQCVFSSPCLLLSTHFLIPLHTAAPNPHDDCGWLHGTSYTASSYPWSRGVGVGVVDRGCNVCCKRVLFFIVLCMFVRVVVGCLSPRVLSVSVPAIYQLCELFSLFPPVLLKLSLPPCSVGLAPLPSFFFSVSLSLCYFFSFPAHPGSFFDPSSCSSTSQ